MQNQKSALGLDGNVTTLIGYLIPIVALILIFIEKDNKFVRFHAFQTVFWAAATIVGLIAIVIVGTILGIVVGVASDTLALGVWGITMLLYVGIFLAYFGGLIFGAIKSYGGTMTKLPVVGNFAEKYS